MALFKWSMIFFYWVWLAIRNAHDNKKLHDWRLGIQILINITVIMCIVMEDRASFIDMVKQIATFTHAFYIKISSLFPK